MVRTGSTDAFETRENGIRRPVPARLHMTFQYPTGLANLMTVANADVHEAARANADRGTILFFIYVMYMSRWPRTVTCT